MHELEELDRRRVVVGLVRPAPLAILDRHVVGVSDDQARLVIQAVELSVQMSCRSSSRSEKTENLMLDEPALMTRIGMRWTLA